MNTHTNVCTHIYTHTHNQGDPGLPGRNGSDGLPGPPGDKGDPGNGSSAQPVRAVFFGGNVRSISIIAY